MVGGLRSAGVWILQTLFVSILLLMLWHPAVSVATLKPQQNVVAVVIDDSRSMALNDGGRSRREQVVTALKSGVLAELQKRFQVRLYRAGTSLERIESPDQLNASVPFTRLGETLRQVVGESASLPVGAVLLLSDGADNAGGIDLPTMDEIRRQHIPIHTVGFGREQNSQDIEMTEAQVPARTLADTRITALVTFHQRGFTGRQVKVNIKDSGKTLASQTVALKGDGVEQTETIAFNAGTSGVRVLNVSVDPQSGEENTSNNSITRLVTVDSTKPRLLYIEGEPRWEYKFLHRAAEADQTLLVSTMLRTTQNKIYRQGIGDPKELEEGFPAKVDELFGYQGIIIGSVEANYFTPTQQELIRQFVDRRGGGVLFLAGRFALSEGGVGSSPLADLVPTILPNKKGTFHRDPADVALTASGRDSLICRLIENPDANVMRWAKLPYLANYQEPGVPKPGAVVLAEMTTDRGKLPLLVTQNYGRGRSALFATSGAWRWQMNQPHEDTSLQTFWQQLMRWMVSGTTGRIVASTPKSVFADETKVRLRAEVRDKNYLPATDAKVEAHLIGPEGLSDTVELHPDPQSQGIFLTDWVADKPGSYVAEVTAKRGEDDTIHDVITFRREDGVAENFHTEQNRDLLEKLATQTGGRYYKPDQVKRIPDEISYSEAGISTRETRDLWDMPILFLIALVLRSGEWMLRRKWGVV
jgi:uncharacterized membrane protein